MTDAEPLRLSFADLHKEIEVVPTLARRFLTPSAASRLDRAKHDLGALLARANTPFVWEIPREEAVQTRPSDAHYERRRERSTQKGPPVFGALSFSWHLRTGSRPVKDVYLVGNASTQLRIKDASGEELCMWRMEIGAADSPGCCFHTQVRGEELEGPFPKWLPVPRLPSYPPTPMACLEFLISELFQKPWQERVERDSDEIRMWRGIQRRRLSSFLLWQLETIEQSTGSPLVDLKRFPGGEVLMRGRG
ncbi:MAG TPA: hypothetical protein VHT29_02835 [Solirubrobacteraceae bacterium]|jgi:hypothetical protein|nr:hypothetical protein [Solirubrobacteraceae bacterium]